MDKGWYLTVKISAANFSVVSRWKQTKSVSSTEQTNVVYDSTIKMNELILETQC